MLRNLFDTCKIEIKNLETHLKIENYSALIAFILLKLLLNDLVHEIDYSTTSRICVSSILDYFNEKIISLELTSAFISFNQNEINPLAVIEKTFIRINNLQMLFHVLLPYLIKINIFWDIEVNVCLRRTRHFQNSIGISERIHGEVEWPMIKRCDRTISSRRWRQNSHGNG